MTNKPMLSVERELLEIYTGRKDGDWVEAGHELRALLDRPVLESQYEGMTQEQAQAVSDGVDEILHGEPAAQHQGEPVAWYKPHWNGLSAEFRLGAELCDAVFPEMWHKLYAEQPAPVAVVMPERKTKADYSGYIEQFQSEAASLYNSALDDVARLNGVKP